MQNILNRKKLNIVVWVENEKGKNGLVFIAHGLSSTHDHAHILKIKEAFLENDYTVVSYDATNSVGQSDGDLQYSTLTGFYEDFEDVINWASSQLWYQEPFVVAGHSLGAACNLLYAFINPEKVKALVPTSAFLSGDITLEHYAVNGTEKWKKDGFILQESKSRPGLIKRFNWTLAEDWYKYNLLEKAQLIKAPTLLIVGNLDILTPFSSQQDLFNTISSKKKELHIIEGSEHTFMEAKHLEEVKIIIKNWVKKLG